MKQHFARIISQNTFYFILLMLVSFPLANAKAEASQEGYYFVEVPRVTSDYIALVNKAGNVFSFVRYNAGSNYEGAFIVKGNLESLQRLKSVHVVEYYEKEDFLKLNPRIIEEPGKEFEVSVLLFSDANHKQIVDNAKSLGLKVKEYSGINDFDVIGSGSVIANLVIPGVQYIDIIEPVYPMNMYASQIHGGHFSQNTWDLYGNNQIVAITDSGFDSANPCSNEAQCDLQTGLHPDIVGRIVAVFDITACNPGCSTTTNDVYGHGTATAGRFAGNGVMNGTNPTTRSYQNGNAGIAPESKLYIQDVATDGNNPAYAIPSSSNAITIQYTPARNAGARIHTLSYGLSGGGAYGATTQKIDQFSFTNKDYLFSVASGNGGASGVLSTVSGTIKNGISVGAEEVPNPNYVVTYGGPSVASFSGIGPTADGRIKPDVIAAFPAVTLRSQAAWFIPSPILGPHYRYFDGTSSSTPVVAGAAALVREYLQRYENMTSPNASSSMIKAVILNGAQDVGYGIPSNEAGWGAVSLADSLPNGPKHLYVWDHQGAITTGQIKTDTISVNAGQPLRVTLVWTDKEPASFSNPIPTLVNNLNLEVIDPVGVVYNGNDFSAPFNSATDSVNNVERVEIQNPIAGNYQIRVIGASVPMPSQTFSVATTANSNDLPLTWTAQPSNIHRNTLTFFSIPVTFSVADPNVGDGPVTMSIISKPSWLSISGLSTSGANAFGTPPTWGDYPVTLQACNRRGQCAQATFHIIVNGDIFLTHTPPVVGTTMMFTLSSPANSNQLYAFVIAFGNTSGIVLPDGRQLGVDLDDLAQLTLNDPASLGMSPTIGALNAAGQASITLPIPNIPIQGLTLHAGWIVINPALGTIPAATLTSTPFTFQ